MRPIKIEAIACMTEDHVIGMDNGIPWRVPADMARFRHLTLGSSVVMGMRTFESIGAPLPDRQNFVLTSRVGKDKLVYDDEIGVWLFSDVQLLFTCASLYSEHLMVIGGQQVYEELLPYCDAVYATVLHGIEVEGDRFFPELDFTEWRLANDEFYEKDSVNLCDYSFFTYVRKH